MAYKCRIYHFQFKGYEVPPSSLSHLIIILCRIYAEIAVIA